MARDFQKATKFRRDLPKFGEVVKQSRGVVPTLGGNTSALEMYWGWNKDATEGQVFKLEANVKCKDCDCNARLSTYVSRQAFDHYLRAV